MPSRLHNGWKARGSMSELWKLPLKAIEVRSGCFTCQQGQRNQVGMTHALAEVEGNLRNAVLAVLNYGNTDTLSVSEEYNSFRVFSLNIL